VSEYQVKTPCIGVCSTGIGDRVCRGCKRFAHEVIHWNSYTNEQKFLIEQRLSEFLSKCVSNKLEVCDQDRLQAALEAHQIEYPGQRDAYCWAYCLLKNAASQVRDPAEFGIRVRDEYAAIPLAQLRRVIDAEYYTLSDAYYERYVNAAELA
jgi:predicted Fe-S protein YdhL (DUF1289 family)